MCLNKQKCGILFLSQTRCNLINWELELKEVDNIPIVSNYKYLGVTISKNLSSSVNISRLKDKVSSFCKMVFILRK
jgi:hypothetical protein